MISDLIGWLNFTKLHTGNFHMENQTGSLRYNYILGHAYLRFGMYKHTHRFHSTVVRRVFLLKMLSYFWLLQKMRKNNCKDIPAVGGENLQICLATT